MECHRYAFRAMGSPCELRLYAPTRARADAAAQAGRAEIERLEQKYSRYRDDSITSRINRSAGDAAGIEVDAETAGLLDYAAQAFTQSEGRFDITSGVLRQAWDFKAGKLPQQAQIDALLPRIGWAKLRWQNPYLVLPLAGMELDFGGYVKEYTADTVAQTCRTAGVAHGLVELGGDIAIIGPHPDGAPWRVGVRDPRLPEQAVAVIDLRAGAIASSGNYERYLDIDGVRYCHILDPRSGWPVQGMAAVSVIAPQCLVAGTASTIAMLMGDDAQNWLNALGLPYLCVDAEGAMNGRLGTTASGRQIRAIES
jgi:thiamine biosynthesis lipoprotein